MKTILVGYDGTASALKAVEHAVELGQGLGRAVTAAEVVPSTLYAFEGQDAESTSLAARWRKKVGDDLASLAVKFPGIQTLQLDGHPAEALATAAERSGASMLVVGAGEKSWLDRLMLGSTADRLIRISKVPVLVVR